MGVVGLLDGLHVVLLIYPAQPALQGVAQVLATPPGATPINFTYNNLQQYVYDRHKNEQEAENLCI
jgi:hypothetical protein